MSYTDGKRAPKPTESERIFASLTDEERDAITWNWLAWHEVTFRNDDLTDVEFLTTEPNE